MTYRYADSNGQHEISEAEYLSLFGPPADLPDGDALVAIQVRAERDGLLLVSDWTQVADAPLSSEKKTEWATYRQSLRDITSQEGFPNNVSWPTQPA
jgi:hypothetical protein